jgi:hypothetical protein
MLTVIGGLCFVGFMNPVGVDPRVLKQRLTASIGPT